MVVSKREEGVDAGKPTRIVGSCGNRFIALAVGREGFLIPFLLLAIFAYELQTHS